MCKTLRDNSTLDDSMKVNIVLKKHFFSYINTFADSLKKEEINQIDIRFQRQCKEYGELIDRNNIQKGDWQRTDRKPEIKMDIEVCNNFLNHKNYYYLSSDGDTIRLTIDKGFWIDRFKDGTYSKLSFHWTNNCEFEIQFIISDNYGRKYFSKPGDKYKYQIVEEKSSYYIMSAEIVGTNQYMTFKLYY